MRLECYAVSGLSSWKGCADMGIWRYAARGDTV